MVFYVESKHLLLYYDIIELNITFMFIYNTFLLTLIVSFYIIFNRKGDFMYSKINQIRYELQKLYESQGLTDEVLKLSRKLDEEINKIQKEKGNIKKTTN